MAIGGGNQISGGWQRRKCLMIQPRPAKQEGRGGGISSEASSVSTVENPDHGRHRKNGG